MLTVASLSLLLEAPVNRPAALLSGLCAALTLAVGMETAPYVAAIGCLRGDAVCFRRPRRKADSQDFGLGFAGVSALVFATTVPPSAWGQAQCDAFSVVQFVVAGLAGTGLAVIASSRTAGGTRSRRLLSLALLGVALVRLSSPCSRNAWPRHMPGSTRAWRPCGSTISTRRNPCSGLPPGNPAEMVARYATPLVAIVLMASRFGRGGWRRPDSLVAVLLPWRSWSAPGRCAARHSRSHWPSFRFRPGSPNGGGAPKPARRAAPCCAWPRLG